MAAASRASVSTLMWRLSLVLAATLIGLSLWLAYELVQDILFFRNVLNAFVGSSHIDWLGVATTLALIALVGIGPPALYLPLAWPRAFPSSSREPEAHG